MKNIKIYVTMIFLVILSFFAGLYCRGENYTPRNWEERKITISEGVELDVLSMRIGYFQCANRKDIASYWIDKDPCYSPHSGVDVCEGFHGKIIQWLTNQ